MSRSILSSQEEVNLCRAWVHVTTTTNKLQELQFWHQVREFFNGLSGNLTLRNDLILLSSRFKFIKEKIDIFAAIVRLLENTRANIIDNEPGRLRMATQLYEDAEKNKFVFASCWSILSQISPCSRCNAIFHNFNVCPEVYCQEHGCTGKWEMATAMMDEREYLFKVYKCSFQSCPGVKYASSYDLYMIPPEDDCRHCGWNPCRHTYNSCDESEHVSSTEDDIEPVNLGDN